MSAFNLATRISGVQKVVDTINQLETAIRRDTVVRGLELAAIQIHETAVKSMRQQSQGRRYGNHVASKPGDPPNIDTGRLVNSIKWEVDENALSAVVGTNLEYGTHLEFGTTKMAARPWLGPALRENQRSILRLFTFRAGGK